MASRRLFCRTAPSCGPRAGSPRTATAAEGAKEDSEAAVQKCKLQFTWPGTDELKRETHLPPAVYTRTTEAEPLTPAGRLVPEDGFQWGRGRERDWALVLETSSRGYRGKHLTPHRCWAAPSPGGATPSGSRPSWGPAPSPVASMGVGWSPCSSPGAWPGPCGAGLSDSRQRSGKARWGLA